MDKICANTVKWLWHWLCSLGGLVGCFDPQFHVHLFAYTYFALWDGIHAICVHNFNFTDRTSFFFSHSAPFRVPFFFAPMCEYQNFVCVVFPSFQKNCSTKSIVCRENHLVFPHFAIAFSLSLSLCSFRTTKKRQISGVFMRCATGTANAIYTLWKCAKQRYKTLTVCIEYENRCVESCHIDGR